MNRESPVRMGRGRQGDHAGRSRPWLWTPVSAVALLALALVGWHRSSLDHAVSPGDDAWQNSPPASRPRRASGPIAVRQSARTAPEPATIGSTARPGTPRIVGRCVAAESSAPLPSAEIAIGAALVDDDACWPTPCRAPASRSTRAGADGRFELSIPAALLDAEPLLAATTDDRAPAWVPLAHHGSAPRLDVGDVPLGPGFRLRGRVVDQDGQPVGGAEVLAHGLPGLTRSNVSMQSRARLALATSAVDGRFTAEIALPAGEVGLIADRTLDVRLPPDAPAPRAR